MQYIDRSKAKILYYDIETAPNLSYVWGQYEQNVIAHVSEWHMLCVSYKWEGQKRAQVCALDDFPEEFKKDPENDEHVAKKLFDLFDEALCLQSRIHDIPFYGALELVTYQHYDLRQQL